MSHSQAESIRILASALAGFGVEATQYIVALKYIDTFIQIASNAKGRTIYFPYEVSRMCAFACLCACLCACISACLCVCLCLWSCACACSCACIRVLVHVRVLVHIHVLVRAHHVAHFSPSLFQANVFGALGQLGSA